MRARFVLIAIALALLAVAGLRHDDLRSSEPRYSSEASRHLAAQPAPDAEPPAIIRAAVPAPATAQTHLACEPRGHVRIAQDLSMARRQAPAGSTYDAAAPRSFPLLI